MGTTLAVDRIRCDGHGLCAELLPELITLDDWGFPIIAGGPVPIGRLENMRRAIDACPVLALRFRADANAVVGRPEPRPPSRPAA